MTEKKKKFEPPIVAPDKNGYGVRDHQYKEGVKSCISCYEEVGKPHSRDCSKFREAWMEHVIPHTDLRSITRGASRCETTITIIDGFRARHTWITCGEVKLRLPDGRDRHEATLTCYLNKGATDFEHDSAYAFQLPLIGWQFDSLYDQNTTFVAWIAPNLHGSFDEFHVPSAGYNPFELDDTHECDEGHCKKHPHPMVPEGHYVPPHNPDLYRLVKGLQLSICVRTLRKDELPKPKGLRKKYARAMDRIEELEELLARAGCAAHEAHEGEIEQCEETICDAVASKLGIKLAGVESEDDDAA